MFRAKSGKEPGAARELRCLQELACYVQLRKEDGSMIALSSEEVSFDFPKDTEPQMTPF